MPTFGLIAGGAHFPRTLKMRFGSYASHTEALRPHKRTAGSPMDTLQAGHHTGFSWPFSSRNIL
jgi:hypothetical protein